MYTSDKGGNELEIGVIGLGKMGLNMALNLKDNSNDVFGYDFSEEAKNQSREKGLTVKENLQELIDSFSSDKKVIMLSLPAGEVTNSMIEEVSDLLSENDVIIDSGNAKYKNSVQNYEYLKEKNIDFLDCGTSGGIEGARNGANLMVGGEQEVFNENESLFEDLATEGGYLYTGKPGSGHYLKMVHNGIEYGMMQAIGEGYDVLNSSRYDYDFEAVSELWSNGSVIRSWLIEIMAEQFADNTDLSDVKGVIDASGEAKWTVEEALALEIPVPVISTSLFVRNATKIEDSFSAKVVAKMRNGFGGHDFTES